jgi:hypothetical protein
MRAFLVHETFGDYELLNFRGTFVDAQGAHVAVKPFCDVSRHDSAAAVNLSAWSTILWAASVAKSLAMDDFKGRSGSPMSQVQAAW